MVQLVSAEATAGDFDFLTGHWIVRNRRLRDRFVGWETWDEFEATAVSRQLLGGLGNEDEFRLAHTGAYVGMAFRFFDPATKLWSIYWADSRRPGLLDPPVFGAFDGHTGVFDGADTYDGRRILVRMTWSRVSTSTPRWEQAFSDDDGDSWETNWVMRFSRPDDSIEEAV
jgi:hypothetical protein